MNDHDRTTDVNRPQISREELLTDLTRVADELGRSPSMTDYTEHGEYSVTVYQSRFGSWNDAKDAAGLYEYPQHGVRISREELLTDLTRVADELGHPPTVEEYREHGDRSAGTYKDRFGSWSEAKAAAGLRTHGERPDFTTHLSTGGPQSPDELPDKPTRNDRRASGFAIQKFRISVGGETPVYYLHDEHTPHQVVSKWVAANESVISDHPTRSIFYKISDHGDEWREAAKDHLELERDTSDSDQPPSGGQDGGTCPLCGEEYPTTLPAHLPCDDDADAE